MQRCHQILQRRGWKFSPPFYTFPADAYFAVCLRVVHNFRDDSHAVVVSRQGGIGEHVAVQSVSLPQGLGAAEVLWVLAAAAPRELPVSPAGKRYSLHLTLKISSEKWLLCSLVYSWYVTLLAKLVHLEGGASCPPGEGVQLDKWPSLLPVLETQGLEQKKSSFPCGRQPTAGLYSSWGDYKLNNVELDFQSEGRTCL